MMRTGRSVEILRAKPSTIDLRIAAARSRDAHAARMAIARPSCDNLTSELADSN